MFMKYIFSMLLAVLFMANANALSVTNASVEAGLSAPVMGSLTAEDAEKMRAIATVENDIMILQTELAKCQKAKKGWIAATVIGSAGVVATGVAAGVQGAKIADKKKELSQHNADIKTKQDQLTNLQGKQ